MLPGPQKRDGACFGIFGILDHFFRNRHISTVERLLHEGADPTTVVVHEGHNYTALDLANSGPSTYIWSLDICDETADRIARSFQLQHEDDIHPPNADRLYRKPPYDWDNRDKQDDAIER